MGWASGSAVMSGIIAVLEKEVPDVETRIRIYEKLIIEFRDWDCDTLDECLEDDPAFFTAYKKWYEERYGEIFDDR
jgi:hypothetical protein